MSTSVSEASKMPPATRARRRPHSITAPTEQPKAVTFTNRFSGHPVTFTCMVGCKNDHELDMASPTMPEDVTCSADSEHVELPFMQSGSQQQWLTLRPQMFVSPFSNDIAERLPTVSVEVTDDGWFSNLDPDGLDQVADFLQGRVDAMRAASVRLTAVRDEYKGRNR